MARLGALRLRYCRWRSTSSRNLPISRDRRAGRRGATRRTPCGCAPISTALSRSLVQPARGPRRDDPVAPRPDRQRRHRRLVGGMRDRRLVDGWPATHSYSRHTLFMLADRPRRASQASPPRAPYPASRAPARARTPRRGSSRPAAPADRRRSARAAAAAARAVSAVRAEVEPELPRMNPPAGRGERAAKLHRGAVAGEKPGMTSAGGPSTGPRGPGWPNPRQNARPAPATSARRRQSAAASSPAKSCFRGTRPPSAPAAPWATAPAHPRSDGSRAAARGCVGSRARCC